jgi:hypothetical protein
MSEPLTITLMLLWPGILYVAVRIAAGAYFHSKKRFIKEMTYGIQVEKEV